MCHSSSKWKKKMVQLSLTWGTPRKQCKTAPFPPEGCTVYWTRPRRPSKSCRGHTRARPEPPQHWRASWAHTWGGWWRTCCTGGLSPLVGSSCTSLYTTGPHCYLQVMVKSSHHSTVLVPVIFHSTMKHTTTFQIPYIWPEISLNC